ASRPRAARDRAAPLRSAGATRRRTGTCGSCARRYGAAAGGREWLVGAKGEYPIHRPFTDEGTNFSRTRRASSSLLLASTKSSGAVAVTASRTIERPSSRSRPATSEVATRYLQSSAPSVTDRRRPAVVRSRARRAHNPTNREEC